MTVRQQIVLTVNVHASGRHDAAWTTLPHPETLSTNIDEFIRIAEISERGKFDALFLADGAGGLPEEAYVRPWRALDPIALQSALSAVTKHIGLIATTSTIFGDPAIVARQIASLDHISKGRAAWNIVTSQNSNAQQAFGLEAPYGQAERYARAEEFVGVVTAFWDSLPREAIVADPQRHIYVDERALRPVDFSGRYFKAAGALGVPQTPQGRPVILQAGTSEESKNLGARWADALFTGQRTIETAKAFYDDVKGRARRFGRDPDKFLVLPGLFPIIGSTEDEARRRKEDLDSRLDLERLKADLAERLGVSADDLQLDAPLPFELIEKAPLAEQLQRRHRDQLVAEAKAKGLDTRQLVYNNITGGHRVTLGTPEQIADDIIAWIDAGAADGFQLNTDIQTDGLEHFADWVIPILQERGRFRTEYTGRTLRENLGLAEYSPAPALARAAVA